MKFFEKIGLSLFSTLVLILSVIVCLLIFGWLDLDWIYKLVEDGINDPMTSNVMLGINTVLILIAIRCIFFDSSTKESNDYKHGILLENEDGKLLITKDTLENLVSSVVKGFESAENITSRVELDKENNVKVFINISVKENAIIKELSMNLQNKVKETIKRTVDLDVKEVNVKVKDIEPAKNTVQE